MSVTAGKYLGGNDVYFASGAPRSNLTGQVFVFKRIHNEVTMDVLFIINGEQFASNFGYEMITTDINNDG